MNLNALLLPFALTLFAGLSTGIGSTIAFFAKRTNTRFLSVALGFSAGVMVYVSFVEILSEARIALTESLGLVKGSWFTAMAFFGGILLIALIDKCVPAMDNPHEVHKVEDLCNAVPNALRCKLLRTGTFAAVAIVIHNFPEGLATFTAAIKDPSLGIVIAVAIAIHNIPEGIAVSVPIYYATGSKRRAFRLSFLAGLSEPLGAVIGYLILMPFMNELVFGLLFAGVAGIMVFISIDELLPAAREYGESHLSIYGFVAGMMVMALSLLMFL